MLYFVNIYTYRLHLGGIFINNTQIKDIEAFTPSSLIGILNSTLISSLGTVSPEIYENCSINEMKKIYDEFSHKYGFGLSVFKKNCTENEQLQNISSARSKEGIRFFVLKGFVSCLKDNYSSNNKLSFFKLHDDIGTELSIDACAPSQICSKLSENKCYLFSGYIFNSVLLNKGEIKFKFNVVDFLSIEEDNNIKKKYLDIIDKYKYLYIYATSREKRDLYSVVKYISDKKLKGDSNEKIKISFIVSSSTIVADIKNKFNDPENFDNNSLFNSLTDIKFKEVNITNLDSIMSMLDDNEVISSDIICIARGGGNNEEFKIFNNLKLCKKLSDLNSVLMVGLGHSDNIFLGANLIADYAVGVPYELSEKIFNTVVCYANEYLSKNNSGYSDDIIKSLENENSLYSNTILSLKEESRKLENTNYFLTKEKSNLEKEVSNLSQENAFIEKQLKKSKIKIAILFLISIISILLFFKT